MIGSFLTESSPNQVQMNNFVQEMRKIEARTSDSRLRIRRVSLFQKE